MAKLYGEIAKSALLTLDKSFSRALGQPLDASEVYYSLEAAKDYALTGTAYVGQKIVVVSEVEKDGVKSTVVTHYSVENTTDRDKVLKEVGAIPLGDGKTIAVDPETKTISIVGSAEAAGQTYPRMKADKSGIEWVGINAIVENAKNTITTGDGVTVITTEKSDGNLEVSLKGQTEATKDSVLRKQADGTFAWEEVYNKDEVNGLISGAFHFKGKADHLGADGNLYSAAEEIPANIITGKQGHVYQVGSTEYVYVEKDGNTAEWVELGSIVDLSAYATTASQTAAINALRTELQGYADTAEADAITAAGELVDGLRDELPGIIADNSDINVIESVKLNGTALSVADDKSVNVVVTPTTLGVYTTTEIDNKVTTLEGLISAASTKGQTGIDNAATAQQKANDAYALADTNKTNLETLQNTVNGHLEDVKEHSTKIGALETLTSTHTGQITTLQGLVETKADTATVSALSENVSKNTTDLATLTGRVDSNAQTLESKANAADVFTKDEVKAITGTPTEGKTIVGMIEAYQTAANEEHTRLDTAVKKNATDITNLGTSLNTTITNLSTDLYATDGRTTSIGKIADDRIAAALAGSHEDFDTLKEMSDWLTEHKGSAATMNSAISDNAAGVKKNKEDIAALSPIVAKLDGDVNTAGSVLNLIEQNKPAIATTEKAGIVKSVAATVENGVAVAADGTMSVNSVNVDKLVQTTGSWLVLNGGGANA